MSNIEKTIHISGNKNWSNGSLIDADSLNNIENTLDYLKNYCSSRKVYCFPIPDSDLTFEFREGDITGTSLGKSILSNSSYYWSTYLFPIFIIPESEKYYVDISALPYNSTIQNSGLINLATVKEKTLSLVDMNINIVTNEKFFIGSSSPQTNTVSTNVLVLSEGVLYVAVDLHNSTVSNTLTVNTITIKKNTYSSSSSSNNELFILYPKEWFEFYSYAKDDNGKLIFKESDN